MSLGNRDFLEDPCYTSHVPEDEGNERGRIVSSATVRAVRHENRKHRVDSESNRSPTVGDFKTEYKSYIPILPNKVSLAYRKDTGSFHALQEWEGYVTDIQKDTFEAELVDLTKKNLHTQERAVFEKSELSVDALELLENGAIFRWSIGHVTKPGGTKQRVSQIVFRRLPAWRQADLQQAKEVAKTIQGSIRWE